MTVPQVVRLQMFLRHKYTRVSCVFDDNFLLTFWQTSHEDIWKQGLMTDANQITNYSMHHLLQCHSNLRSLKPFSSLLTSIWHDLSVRICSSLVRINLNSTTYHLLTLIMYQTTTLNILAIFSHNYISNNELLAFFPNRPFTRGWHPSLYLDSVR